MIVSDMQPVGAVKQESFNAEPTATHGFGVAVGSALNELICQLPGAGGTT